LKKHSIRRRFFVSKLKDPSDSAIFARSILNGARFLKIYRKAKACSPKPIRRIGLVSIRRIDSMPIRRTGFGFKDEPPLNFLDFVMPLPISQLAINEKGSRPPPPESFGGGARAPYNGVHMSRGGNPVHAILAMGITPREAEPLLAYHKHTTYAEWHQVFEISSRAAARSLTPIQRAGFGFKSEPHRNFLNFCDVIQHIPTPKGGDPWTHGERLADRRQSGS
jgi:hypothetical protein